MEQSNERKGENSTKRKKLTIISYTKESAQRYTVIVLVGGGQGIPLSLSWLGEGRGYPCASPGWGRGGEGRGYSCPCPGWGSGGLIPVLVLVGGGEGILLS